MLMALLLTLVPASLAQANCYHQKTYLSMVNDLDLQSRSLLEDFKSLHFKINSMHTQVSFYQLEKEIIFGHLPELIESAKSWVSIDNRHTALVKKHEEFTEVLFKISKECPREYRLNF